MYITDGPPNWLSLKTQLLLHFYLDVAISACGICKCVYTAMAIQSSYHQAAIYSSTYSIAPSVTEELIIALRPVINMTLPAMIISVETNS